jgi:proteic killer suppression protein
MIRRVRHRGLRRLYADDDRRGVNPEHVEKIARVLARLDVAVRPADLDLPGFRLHPLTGDLAGYWSITIRANWRIIFVSRRGMSRMSICLIITRVGGMAWR